MVAAVSRDDPSMMTGRREGGEAESRGFLRAPALVLALLTGLNLLNYVDRYVLAAVLGKVQDDLHLSNFAGGSLATVFLIGYFVTSPIFGTLADRGGAGRRKRLMALGVSVWSVATVASGLVHGLWALVCARALVGVGEASYATIAPTLIDDIAPREKKARWLAIFYTAIPAGSALGYIVGGAVEHSRGWRSAFFVAGVPGIVLALLCLAIATPAAASSRPVAMTPGMSAGRPSSANAPKGDTFSERLGGYRRELWQAARLLLRIPLYRRGVAGYCAYTFAIGGFAYWAPKYLYQRYGLDAGLASVAFGKMTVVAGIVGTLSGGFLADLVVRRRNAARAADDETVVRANLAVCAWSVGLGAPLAAAAVLAPSATTFFAFATPAEVALFVSTGPVNVAQMRSVPPGLRASAMALGIFAIHALGDLWSPPLIGIASDVAPMSWAMLSVPIVFAVASFVWWRASARLT
jgi:MFS transporter, Spinster family, sphingosine-1-phosphate transporter